MSQFFFGPIRTTVPGQLLFEPSGSPVPIIGLGMVVSQPQDLVYGRLGFLSLYFEVDIGGEKPQLEIPVGVAWGNFPFIPLARGYKPFRLAFRHSEFQRRPLTFRLVVEIA